MSTSGELVWCVICVDSSGDERTHIFSSDDRRRQWVNSQPDDGSLYIHYDYVIDDPDRMDKPRSLPS